AISDKNVSARIGMKGLDSMGSMMQGMGGMDAMKNFGGMDSDIINSLLKNLSDMQNPQVTSGSMDATLNNGYVSGAVINVTVTGADSAGVLHTMVFAVNVSLSNIGSTTVSAIDTTGKTVISSDMFNMFKMNGTNNNND
ncbi:MAG: hypothetical protein FWD71_20150, partial [Oscillospiraceae bacterium]|nr:hypothetical protein [Oscillospiraceae bacterium]